ncbi:MAG TPA: ATP-binding protein [Vicinamibacterales bacterium]
MSHLPGDGSAPDETPKPESYSIGASGPGGDPGPLLENLLGNAWKFTANAPQPTVQFGAESHDEGLVYFVRDNGVGFDMAYTSKLFRPFQRLHHEADFPGTGIGLATVRRIIDRHGGRVWAGS